MERYEEKHTRLHAVLAARDAGIVHAVAALVAVERCLACLLYTSPKTGGMGMKSGFVTLNFQIVT